MNRAHIFGGDEKVFRPGRSYLILESVRSHCTGTVEARRRSLRARASSVSLTRTSVWT